MKNTLLKTFGSATLAILMFAALAQNSIFAQDNKSDEQIKEQTQEDLSMQRANNETLIGTWDAQVTIRNCQTGTAIRTFASTTTFMSGGTLIDSTSGIPQALKTPGHGVWTYLGGNTYRLKIKSFSFDANGNFTGWTIIQHEANIVFPLVLSNQRTNKYTSAGTAEVYAPNGALVATGCSSSVSTRFE